MIFHEIYGAYYAAVAAILREALSHPLSRTEMRAITEAHAFGESFPVIEDALRSRRWPLLREDGTPAVKHVPELPLTNLQKRWLKAISSDPRLRLFGDVLPDLDGVEPLFVPEDIRVFDAYADGDDYTDEGYIARFRFILSAVRESRPLRITAVSRKGGTFTFSAMPEYLEYSEKDDKFRLAVSGCRRVTYVNLGRIRSCAYSGRDLSRAPGQRMHAAGKEVVLTVTDERKALERVLLHFAHFEKRAEQLGNRQYRVTVRYDADDETEMVIRILSFGPLVRVESPASFVDLIRDRLRRQMDLGL